MGRLRTGMVIPLWLGVSGWFFLMPGCTPEKDAESPETSRTGDTSASSPSAQPDPTTITTSSPASELDTIYPWEALVERYHFFYCRMQELNRQNRRNSPEFQQVKDTLRSLMEALNQVEAEMKNRPKSAEARKYQQKITQAIQCP